MVNGCVQVKIKKKTHKKFKQLQRLYGFKEERDITFSEILEDMMEKKFKEFDGMKITREN